MKTNRRNFLRTAATAGAGAVAASSLSGCGRSIASESAMPEIKAAASRQHT